MKAPYTQTSDPEAVFNAPAFANWPSRKRSAAEPRLIVPPFELAPFELAPVGYAVSGAPIMVKVSVEATVRVAFTLVLRVLMVALATAMPVADDGSITQSLVELGTVCGLQLPLSLNLLLDPPSRCNIDMDASSVGRHDVNEAQLTRS